jgi:hypothetical protein
MVFSCKQAYIFRQGFFRSLSAIFATGMNIKLVFPFHIVANLSFLKPSGLVCSFRILISRFFWQKPWPTQQKENSNIICINVERSIQSKTSHTLLPALMTPSLPPLILAVACSICLKMKFRLLTVLNHAAPLICSFVAFAERTSALRFLPYTNFILISNHKIVEKMRTQP